MSLRNYLDRYNLAHDIKPSTLEHYTWVVHSLDAYTGHQTALADLSADLLNGYLLWLRERCSPFTCKQRRASLLVLWRSANEEGLAPPVPKIRPVRTPDPPKDVWTPADVAQLIAAASVLAGPFRNMAIDRVKYFRTLIAAAYESGLRRSDLHAMQADQVREATSIAQLKTGRCVVARFTAATCAEILAFVAGTDRNTIWPLWSKHRGVFGRMFGRIVAAAGLRGSFSKLRKTSGTEVERLAPGAGWVHLGHSSPDTARIWYINQARAYAGNVPLPPDLPLDSC